MLKIEMVHSDDLLLRFDIFSLSFQNEAFYAIIYREWVITLLNVSVVVIVKKHLFGSEIFSLNYSKRTGVVIMTVITLQDIITM